MPTKPGRVFAVVSDVLDVDARHPQPDDRSRGGHPVIGIGVPGAAVQRGGCDVEPVLGLGDIPAEAR